jgi:hypothetical protein
MIELGAGSGVKILEDGERLLIVDSRTSSLSVVVFVLGLLTFILGGGGIALAVAASAAAGLGLLGAGALFGLGLALALRALLRRRRRPAGELAPHALIDLGARTLCDGSGRVLAPLAQVRFRRKFQLGSSSPALCASFAGGELILARGNPFAGGLGTLEDALRSRRLM